MPVIEIASWIPSDAYLASHDVLRPALNYLKKVDGCQDVFTGVAEEENVIYAFLVWETYEHHKALMNHPEYPDVIGLAPSIGQGGININHVEFIKDFVPALTAPSTEILVLTLKEGKTKDDLWKVLDSISAKINAVNTKYVPVTWGQTLEDTQKFYLTIGWDSSDAHRQIVGDASFVSDLTDLRNTAALKMVHASLKKHA